MQDKPDHFKVVAGRGFFRPRGQYELQAAVDEVDAVLAYCRVNGIRELLVNGIRVTGFEPPSLGKRYFLVEQWALTARGAVRVALVLRPEMIDPQKFGITVALNRRLVADVFTDEVDAVAWLDRRTRPHGLGPEYRLSV